MNLKKKFIPEVSYLMIDHWTQNRISSSDELINEILLQLLEEIIGLDNSFDFTFHSYELFCAFWLAIRILCLMSFEYDNEKNFRLKKNYDPTQSFTINSIFPVGLRGEKNQKLFSCPIKFKRGSPIKKSIERLSEMPMDELISNIYIMEENNPGFDVMFFGKLEENDKLIAICIECKFSFKGSTSKIYLESVEEKRAKTLREVKKLGIENENVVFVYSAWRNSPQYIDSRNRYLGSLPLNTILLRKKDLKFLYGPLCNRPYFEDDYTEKYLWSLTVDELVDIAKNELNIEAHNGEKKEFIIQKILTEESNTIPEESNTIPEEESNTIPEEESNTIPEDSKFLEENVIDQ